MKTGISQVTVKLSGREILHNISAEFPEQGISLLIGGNGSGKSTLLKTVAGLLPAAGGTVTFDGVDIAGISRREIARKCAILLQDPYAPPEMSVRELTALGRFPHGGSGSINAPEVIRAMDDAGITYAAGRVLGTLSGGERRRAFLARALAQETPLLLLDEPEAALDAAAKNELLRTLKKLGDSRKLQVIMAVHDLDFALGTAEYICGIKAGAVLFSGTPDKVITPGNIRELYGISASVFHDQNHRLRMLPEYR
jgi:iron complex transport system ATP-binding protein